jgi:hypothetical protein
MKTPYLALLVLLACLSLVRAGVGPEKLKRKIIDLRSDRKAENCGAAMDFLSHNVEDQKVQTALLEELYSTKDWQAKESCLVLLCKAKTFQPDEKFMRLLLARVRDWGRPEFFCCEPAGDAGAIFLVGQTPRFADLIASEIREGFSPKDNSLWYQYVIIRALAKTRLIDKYADRFPAGYLKSLAENLQNDEITCNAMVATGAFLFLGKVGIPFLKDVPRASDLQGRELASSILSCLSAKTPFSELAEREESACGALAEGDLGDFDLDKPVNEQVLVGPVPEGHTERD